MKRKEKFFNQEHMELLSELTDGSCHDNKCICNYCRSNTATVYKSRLGLSHVLDDMPDVWPFFQYGK